VSPGTSTRLDIPGDLHSLERLRRRLTAWYVLTFGTILVVIGIGLFVALDRQRVAQLDSALRDATGDIARVISMRAIPPDAPRDLAAILNGFRVPGLRLYLLSSTGSPIAPRVPDPWIDEAARGAAATGESTLGRETVDDHTMRVHAERFQTRDGTVLIAVASADIVESEDRYASPIVAFAGAALLALVLIAAGGSLLARKSTAPVERTLGYMRRFMADAAHELRTPLTVLRTRAEVTLQQDRDQAAYVSALQGIVDDSERLARIVNDLLTLARADAGDRPPERQRVFLDDIALEAATAQRVVAQAKGVAIEMDEFEEAMVEGDPAQLRQLIVILLDNAVKFTDRGGTVRVGVSAPGKRPQLVVDDTGRGIAAEHLPHIFERFYRVDAARSRDEADGAFGHGVGLGLSIARWIAEGHRAEIDVRSVPGNGTTVTVMFPAAA
jgi:signal transduction histidine kinase